MRVGSLRIALAQLNPTVGDLDGNAAIVARAIEQAEEWGADVVATPELVVTGYPPEDLVLQPSFVRDNQNALRRLAPCATKAAAIVGFVDRQGDRLFNAAALLADGEIRGVYHKHRLPNYGVFDEERYFEPGEGILLGRVRGVTFGITICEDVWSPDGPHTSCATSGASIIVNINGSPYHTGKSRERRELLSARAREQAVVFAYVNMVGGQDELVFDGQSLVVGPDGCLLARGQPFREDLMVVDVDTVGGTGGRGSARPAEPVRLVDLGNNLRDPRPPLPHPVAPELEPVAETYHALVMGVGDYLRKNRFTQALVGLSGGIDSSLTATIAADAIGPTNVLGVLLPSEYTSAESLSYADRLAEALGIETVTLPITGAYQELLTALEPVFAESPHGLAQENLQSRIRGTLLMALSNFTGRILLSTGNKSEMATGYSTLYGDLAGGFAVLKDVSKTLAYRLARWRNTDREVIPAEVLTRPPTAELRPGQLDTDSLPPYDVLDPILEAYVEGDSGLEQMVARGFDPAVARRVLELVDRAEYKRRQAPPGVKITRRAFGRDRRLPITNRYQPVPKG